MLPLYKDDSGLTARLEVAEPPWEPRVLVVDDDEVSRLAAAGLLQSLGLAVDAAGDGREALEMTTRWPYVAIFMDCEMPEVDGYTAARHLRARDLRNAHTPVIAMTSKPRWVSLAAGMDYHLSKPLEVDLLRADCRRLALLGRDGAGPSAAVMPLGLDAPLLDLFIFPDTTAGGRAGPAYAGATFIREAVDWLPELWRSVNAGDGGSLQRVAHILRDGALAVGAQRVADLCDRLGETNVHGATLSAAEIEPQLRGVLADTAAAIRAYTDGEPSAERSALHLVGPGDAAIAAAESVRPVRIALADDDPLARIAISAMLEGTDWLELIGRAAGVDEIVELVTVQRPDVVVLDWMMPGGGGREAARQIADQCPATLIVGLTSSDSVDALPEMTSAGAVCLVAKGGSAEQLAKTIARALKVSAASHPAPADRPAVASGIGPVTPASGESPLDEAGIQRLRSEFGSTGLLAELVELFGSQTPDRLGDMRLANRAGDAAALRAAAHQLKGGCLTLAAVHMAELCDQLEVAAGEGSLDGVATLVDLIERDFVRAYAALSVITSPHDL